MRRVLLLALAAAALGAAPAEARLEQAAACRPGTTAAVIAGKRVCLRAGQRCARRLDRQYHRYRFHCHGGRLARFAPARPAPPAPREPAIDVRVLGPETVVWDHKWDWCDQHDAPNVSPRALRDADGLVHLYVSDRRRMSGAGLDGVRRDCGQHSVAHNDPRPAWFDDVEFPFGFYTDDGRTVFALVQSVYLGHRYPSVCPSRDHDRCMSTSVTLALSSDGGRSFHHPQPPGHLVGTMPVPYDPNVGPVGLFAGTSIVRHPTDGHFYAAYWQIPHPRLPFVRGTCVMRTSNLADPRSWRAWDGRGFNVAFVDPYRETVADPNRHVCTPVFTGGLASMGESLAWSSYLERFVMVGTGNHGTSGGFYFSTSRDLMTWSPQRLIVPGEMNFTYQCGDPEPMAYGSLLDPTSESRSFDTVGQRPYLYFVRMRYENCAYTGRSDVVRVPLEFTRTP